jgi:hypothetical protein
MMHLGKSVAVVSVLALCSCGTSPGDRVASGAGIGAATGVVLGTLIGIGPLAGTALGAAGGAAAGAFTTASTVNLGEPVWRPSANKRTNGAPVTAVPSASPASYSPQPVTSTSPPNPASVSPSPSTPVSEYPLR